jgi:Calcium binding
MFIMMPWENEGMAVSLMQLKVVHGDDKTKEAVSVWHYWFNRSYKFG